MQETSEELDLPRSLFAWGLHRQDETATVVFMVF